MSSTCFLKDFRLNVLKKDQSVSWVLHLNMDLSEEKVGLDALLCHLALLCLLNEVKDFEKSILIVASQKRDSGLKYLSLDGSCEVSVI